MYKCVCVYPFVRVLVCAQTSCHYAQIKTLIFSLTQKIFGDRFSTTTITGINGSNINNNSNKQVQKINSNNPNLICKG